MPRKAKQRKWNKRKRSEAIKRYKRNKKLSKKSNKKSNYTKRAY